MTVTGEDGQTFELDHGCVVIAAITSCTNTSNPSVMIAAGLVAKKAVERGLERKPWVKSSLAPGSKVVTEYYEQAGLDRYLDELGFQTVGYGCTTCIGNSGPLPDEISRAVTESDLAVASVLSGNRNFEARIHPEVKANYLASAARRRLRAHRTDRRRPDERSARAGPRRCGRLPPRPVADQRRGAGDRRCGRAAGHVPADARRRVHGRRALALAPVPEGELFAWDDGSVHSPSAVLRGRRRGPGGRRRHRRTLPRHGRRQRHDRPHLAGRLDQARQPGGPVPDRGRRRAAGVQLVRLPARKPRGHGARDVRQRAAPKPPWEARARGRSTSRAARR